MLNCKSMLKNISKGQSAIPLRYIISGLEGEFASLRYSIKVLHVDKKDAYTTIFYAAPSISMPNLMYDCVFEFHESNINKVTTDTPFKVYCNSPSFYFRYANTFRTHNSLLYAEKYPALLNDEAKIRNPNQVTGFDKYVYSCLRYSMTDTIDGLKQKQYMDKPPTVDSFNKKRFEYIKLQKLKKVSEDGIVL